MTGAQNKPFYRVFHFQAGIITLILSCALFVNSCAPPLPDYGIYANLRAYMEQKLSDHGAVVRQDFPSLFSNEYIINLNALFSLVFGGKQLKVHLASYESSMIAVASMSQFEVPPDSENFTDFAFTIRPSANIRAPFLHGDALKGNAGSDSSFAIDFYNINQENIDWEEFFGDQIQKLNDGLALVAPYQRQGEDRSQYIQHIIQYSATNYRIEIDEGYIPEGGDREAYYDAMLAAFQLYLDAYFTALERLTAETDQALIDGTKQGTDTFIDTMYEEDFAASMGKTLFGEDFDTYFLNGFWRDGYYGDGL